MKKVLLQLLTGVATIAAPFFGATQATDQTLSVALAALSGVGVGVTGAVILVTSGSKLLGSLVSFLGRRKYGRDRWENDIEPIVEKGLEGLNEGLNEDDKTK